MSKISRRWIEEKKKKEKSMGTILKKYINND